MKFGYIPAATGLLVKEEDQIKTVGNYFTSLDEIGGQRLNLVQTDNPNPLFYFLITGGTENTILQLLENRKKHIPGEPVYIIAHPGNNSLPASLEVLARLNQDGIRGRIFYLKNPHDTEGLKKILEAQHDLEVWHDLKKTKLGLVGTASDWLVASKPEVKIVKQVWGPEVMHIDFYELKKRMREAEFAQLQQRRSQTEARISIFKNGFLGSPLLSQGYGNQQREVAWSVLAHNLWVIARLPRCQAKTLAQAS